MHPDLRSAHAMNLRALRALGEDADPTERTRLAQAVAATWRAMNGDAESGPDVLEGVESIAALMGTSAWPPERTLAIVASGFGVDWHAEREEIETLLRDARASKEPDGEDALTAADEEEIREASLLLLAGYVACLLSAPRVRLGRRLKRSFSPGCVWTPRKWRSLSEIACTARPDSRQSGTGHAISSSISGRCVGSPSRTQPTPLQSEHRCTGSP